jgi:hypothetical protein
VERKQESIGAKTALLVGANAIPLGAVATFLVLWHRGDVSLKPLPPGSVSILVVLALALVAIVLLAWTAHPVLRAALARVRAGTRATRKRLREGGLVSSLVNGPLLVAQMLMGLVLWLDLLLLVLLIVGLLLLEGATLLRFVTNLRG